MISDFEFIESVIKGSFIRESYQGNYELCINENCFVIFDSFKKSDGYIFFHQKDLLVFAYKI